MANQGRRFWLASIGAVAVVGGCVGGVRLVASDGFQATPSVRSARVDPAPSTIVSGRPGRLSPYRNGRYTVTGHYSTPGGNESIGVRIELAGGVITAAQVTTEALSPTARQFQEQFREHISAAVVSRDIASLSVSRVSGSSLTSVGFNQALSQIKYQAQHAEQAR